MKRIVTAAAALGAAAFGLSACDVQKTQNGSLPTVNVSGGQLPEYNVTGPDVKVGTKTETVKVPTVEVKTGSEKRKESH
ncbi:MAG: hypothetical protein JO013_09750 [Alphaproteobacteria bacterium]|nr:hypothetical protein [Alphaproteobacteria bacterium]